MTAKIDNAIPFKDPYDNPPKDSQVAIGMVIDLKRQVERQEMFWKYFACASLLTFSTFLYYAWSSGIAVFKDIQGEIEMQKELRDEINSVNFKLYTTTQELELHKAELQQDHPDH